MSIARLKPVTMKPLDKAPPRPFLDKPSGPSLAALGDQVEKRLRDWSRNDSNARVELGGLLARIHSQLDHGEWLTWVSEHLPFSARSAQKLIELHQWAERHALRFPDLAPLGPTKLYVLMRLGDALLAGFVSRPLHVVPSTGERKTLARMTVAELTEIVRAKDGIPDPDVATLVLDHYRARVRSVVRAMEAVVELQADISVDEVEALHDELLTAAAVLSDTFHLGN